MPKPSHHHVSFLLLAGLLLLITLIVGCTPSSRESRTEDAAEAEEEGQFPSISDEPPLTPEECMQVCSGDECPDYAEEACSG